VARHADLGVDVARRGHGAHAGQPGEGLVLVRDGVPAVLAEAGDVLRDVRGGLPVRQVDAPVAARVFHRRPDAVAPGPLVLVAGGGEGGAGELFAVKPVVHLLGRVHPLRQGAGQGLGFEIVAEAGHVAFMRAGGVRRADHAARKVVGGHRGSSPPGRGQEIPVRRGRSRIVGGRAGRAASVGWREGASVAKRVCAGSRVGSGGGPFHRCGGSAGSGRGAAFAWSATQAVPAPARGMALRAGCAGALYGCVRIFPPRSGQA